MKRRWTLDELIDQWTLLPNEMQVVNNARTDKNKLGLALLLKWFQHENRFPWRKQEIPTEVLDFLARQLSVEVDVFRQYALKGRTTARHRMLVRKFFGFREATVEDAAALTNWLVESVLSQQRKLEALTLAVYDRCRTLHLEPPSTRRIERITRSALRTADELFFEATMAKLPSSTRIGLDTLLTTTFGNASPQADTIGRSTLHQLKQGAGAVKLDSVFAELDKLQIIEELDLPNDLFANCSPKVLESYHQRIAVEGLHEVRRHPDAVRCTLLAAFCWQRRREIVDTLVDLLIDIVHRMKIKAERKTEKIVLRELKRVRGKGRLLYEIAEASVDKPDDSVRSFIYPVADEQTLRDVIVEFKTIGTYDRQVRTRMRSSYGQHYRRMVPSILKMLTFRSNNEVHQPIIAALSLLKTYAYSDRR
jgi:hypothetical protein